MKKNMKSLQKKRMRIIPTLLKVLKLYYLTYYDGWRMVTSGNWREAFSAPSEKGGVCLFPVSMVKEQSKSGQLNEEKSRVVTNKFSTLEWRRFSYSVQFSFIELSSFQEKRAKYFPICFHFPNLQVVPFSVAFLIVFPYRFDSLY